VATTVTIQSSLNWITAFVLQRPTTGIGGIANEPGLTSANYIMQTILSAPFRWEWNRTYDQSAITTIIGTSDYKISLPTYGYLEKAILINAGATGATPPNFELEIFDVLANDGKQNRPAKICPLLDDNAGNITFRLFPVPDKVYTVDLIFQNAPILQTSLTASGGIGTWEPIPDKYAYLYEQGLKSMLQGMYNAQLYMAGMELFFRQLVAACQGLTEAERNIFLEDSLRSAKMKGAELLATQQGRQARM